MAANRSMPVVTVFNPSGKTIAVPLGVVEYVVPFHSWNSITAMAGGILITVNLGDPSFDEN
jgi:hypothetical protein